MKIVLHGIVYEVVELNRAKRRLRAHFDRISHRIIMSEFQFKES